MRTTSGPAHFTFDHATTNYQRYSYREGKKEFVVYLPTYLFPQRINVNSVPMIVSVEDEARIPRDPDELVGRTMVMTVEPAPRTEAKQLLVAILQELRKLNAKKVRKPTTKRRR
jgi:hypothetical protein